MSGKPEYLKKYPCPHCDVMKHGTAQLLAHIRNEHTEVVNKEAPSKTASKVPLLNPASVMIGVAVTVIYQIHENASKGPTFMVEHGLAAIALIILMQVIAAQIVRSIR